MFNKVYFYMYNQKTFIIFIKYNFVIIFDFLLFLSLHILINLLINNYVKSFLIVFIIYFFYLLKYRKNLTYLTTVILTFFIFTFTVPILNERSLTIFLLNKVKLQKIITEKELSIMYNNEYIIDEKKFLFQRLNEQVLAGNLIKKDNYELTLKGKLFVAIYSFFDLVY